VEIFKEFTFDAAHWLPNVPAGHKCGKLHGHTYRVVIAVEGPVNQHTGFVLDFADLKEAAKHTIDWLDHSCLNDSLRNPTAENLVDYFWEILTEEDGLQVSSIEVWETPTSGARRRALPG
jgi:6-pyruvoyltetrahydropterin/6-carboxytetrahydropterin synthase